MERRDMKKVYRYLLTIVLAGSLASCNFLDENMNTHYTAQDIYGSEEALETYLNGCYAAFAGAGFRGGSMNEWLTPASAIVHWGGLSGRLTDGQKRWIDCLHLTQFSKNPYNYDFFSKLYKTIYKCNLLLENLPASPVDPAYKEQIAAEAYFVRAEAYFHLVRRWGNVPIHTDVPHTIDKTNGKRMNFWEVYGLVLKDLDYAEKYMRPYDEQYQIVNLGSGRPCSTAATAVKSLVYLTIGTLLAHSNPGDNFWTCPNAEVFAGFSKIGIPDAKTAFEKSLACAKQVMPETNPASPYKLAKSYADLFRWENPEDFQLRERIFVIPNTNEAGGSQLATWSLPQQYMGSQKSSNYGRIRPSRFLFQRWCEAYGGVKGNGKAADIYVKCGDPRMDIALIYDTFQATATETEVCYPNEQGIYCFNSNVRSMPYFKKYYDPKYDATPGYADLYVMRLAEVYLIAAEAAANLCSSPSTDYGQQAVEYVNVLLKRARLSTPDGVESAEPAAWDASKILDKDELIEKIFWERVFEMCGEEHEYFDSHRMGAKWFAEHVTIFHNEFLFKPEQDDYNNLLGHRSQYFGNATHGEGNIFPVTQEEVRKGLICAFPNDELVYNTELTLDDQNPSEIFWE